MPQRRQHSGIIMGLLALGLLAGAALTASSAQAASGPGPFYAEPAWDQKLACFTIANCPRFVVLTNWANAAVLDKETGLVWEGSPATTTHTWIQARFECTSRTTGNRKGWRLPSIHELTSLVFPSQGNPALPLGHPFTNIQLGGATGYWSATTNAESPTDAGLVNFGSGLVNNVDKVNGLLAWCVRGGMNADTY